MSYIKQTQERTRVPRYFNPTASEYNGTTLVRSASLDSAYLAHPSLRRSASLATFEASGPKKGEEDSKLPAYAAQDADRKVNDSVSFVPTVEQITGLLKQGDAAEEARAKGEKGLLLSKYFKVSTLCPDSFDPNDTILAKLGRGDIGRGGYVGDKAILTVIDDVKMPLGGGSMGPNGVLTDCQLTYGNNRINLFQNEKKGDLLDPNEFRTKWIEGYKMGETYRKQVITYGQEKADETAASEGDMKFRWAESKNKHDKRWYRLAEEYIKLRDVRKNLETIFEHYVIKLFQHDGGELARQEWHQYESVFNFDDGQYKIDLGKGDTEDNILRKEYRDDYTRVCELMYAVLVWTRSWCTLKGMGIGVKSFCQTWIRNPTIGNAHFSVMSPHFQTRFYIEDEQALRKKFEEDAQILGNYQPTDKQKEWSTVGHPFKKKKARITEAHFESYARIAKYFGTLMAEEYGGKDGQGQAFIDIDGLLKTL